MSPPVKLGILTSAYFFGRKFERVIELSDQISAEESVRQLQSIFSGRKLRFSWPRRGRGALLKPTSIAKDGMNRVMEIWFNEGRCVCARPLEQDIECEGFRKLGLRICATDEELRKDILTTQSACRKCVKT